MCFEGERRLELGWGAQGVMGREEGKKATLFFSSSFPMSPCAPQPNPNFPSPLELINVDWVRFWLSDHYTGH